MPTRRDAKSLPGAPKGRKSGAPALNQPQGNAGEQQSRLDESDPRQPGFVPESLDRTVIAIPLLHILENEKLGKTAPVIHPVIIDLNLDFPGGRAAARKYVKEKISDILGSSAPQRGEGLRFKIDAAGDGENILEQYVFAKLGAAAIRLLVQADGDPDDPVKKKVVQQGRRVRAIYHIWPDFSVRPCTNKSISTVKADAARASFAAFGADIVWAVLDSGIDVQHPHFRKHANVALDSPLEACDLTGEANTTGDPYGHGTHVAGIIAGEFGAAKRASASRAGKAAINAAVRSRAENGKTAYQLEKLDAISGMAPKCKLLNMRVLNSNGDGEVSSVLAALAKIQEINGHGRHLLIHGVNLSLGNNFEPEWFACGHSPLCVEVDRLVESGVVVVAAAGNSGYGALRSEFTGELKMGMALTINDPGNADLAISVGSTHRDMPHTYGVSYFSSKGPTGDGRLKPDIVAPGEKIISCAAGGFRQRAKDEGGIDCDYVENSGTSMAAPHVSGVIAAFLSVRREFIGQPKEVKRIFLSTATDLGRERYFQGNGLVDLMRAIQSV